MRMALRCVIRRVLFRIDDTPIMFPMLMESEEFPKWTPDALPQVGLGVDVALIVNTASYNIVVWGKSSDTTNNG